MSAILFPHSHLGENQNFSRNIYEKTTTNMIQKNFTTGKTPFGVD